MPRMDRWDGGALKALEARCQAVDLQPLDNSAPTSPETAQRPPGAST